MTAPVRPLIHSLIETEKDPKDMTLRDAIEWFKRVAFNNEVGVATALETQLVDERWALLMGAIAEREGVPVGMVSYLVHEVAVSEYRLRQQAVADTQEALLQ